MTALTSSYWDFFWVSFIVATINNVAGFVHDKFALPPFEVLKLYAHANLTTLHKRG